MVNVLWLNKSKNTVIVNKANNEIVILSIGDFITYKGRPDGVRVDGFTGNTYDEGPIGMEYLPWRKQESRWADFLWSLKGNVRHAIAYPCGMTHYGEQIDWDTVELLNGGLCPVVSPVPMVSPIPIVQPSPPPVALQAQQ